MIAGMTDIASLHAALKDAENGLCELVHQLVNKGWDRNSGDNVLERTAANAW